MTKRLRKTKIIMKKMILNDQIVQFKDHVKNANINYSLTKTKSNDESVH